MIKLGQRIKELRKYAGISQQRLAEMLKISRPAVSQIENDERKISAEELVKLSEISNLSVESLLNPTQPPEVVFKEGKKAVKTRKPRIKINIPQKKLEKFREILLYILNKESSPAVLSKEKEFNPESG